MGRHEGSPSALLPRAQPGVWRSRAQQLTQCLEPGCSCSACSPSSASTFFFPCIRMSCAHRMPGIREFNSATPKLLLVLEESGHEDQAFAWGGVKCEALRIEPQQLTAITGDRRYRRLHAKCRSPSPSLLPIANSGPCTRPPPQWTHTMAFRALRLLSVSRVPESSPPVPGPLGPQPM